MTVEHPSSAKKVIVNTEVVSQLQEATGASYEEANQAYIASNHNFDEAFGLLTDRQNHNGSYKGEANQTGTQTFIGPQNAPGKTEADVIDLTKDKDDDLEKAIALSLQEAQGITVEEQDISRVLEASLAENKSGLKRKRGDPWVRFVDPVNPYERQRQDGCPVGLKNVGNTCWFSAVIQSLFHLPVFRRLVLNYIPPTDPPDKQEDSYRVSFMTELRIIFALMLGSKRKYVDPTKAVQILKEALKYNGSESNPGNQQDVSEFTHKLLEWLEDSFKEKKTSSSPAKRLNPVVELFFGQANVEGVYEGKTFSKKETFGAFPLQVQGYSDLHDSLEGAMAQVEIEPVGSEGTHKSGQEHWFTGLPVVLKFMLSRFLFNQSTGRAEKIHDRLLFDPVIHMDRYMEGNKEVTRTYREEVKKLKERRAMLKSSLEKYLKYGQGSKRCPVQDVLESTLTFVHSTAPASDELSSDVDMKTPMSGSPTPMNTNQATPSPCPLSEVRWSPAPRHVTETEVAVLEECLRRWRREMEQDVKDLNAHLRDTEEKISTIYDDASLKKLPYRLHAVLVHEGQASGGHYWAYIQDPKQQRWCKFNDITVSEVTWDEVSRESLGGYRHVSAYCLMYIDARREGCIGAGSAIQELPADLQELVDKDNAVFESELRDWDEKQLNKVAESQCKAIVPRPDIIVDAESVQTSENDEESALNSLAETARSLGVEEALTQWCIQQRTRLERLSREYTPEYPGDVRLEHFGIYLMKCKAPEQMISMAILEQIVDDIRTQEETLLMVKQSGQNRLIAEQVSSNLEYQSWKEKYSLFIKVNSCFLTGLENLQNNKYREALPYLMYACKLNTKLLDASSNVGQAMDEQLLTHWRRICFSRLNELAVEMFNSSDWKSVCRGLELVSELVIPCIPKLIVSAQAADGLAVEQVRNCWCNFLASPLDDRHRAKLEEFLPQLLDVPSESCPEIKPPPIMRPLSSRELCDRFVQAMGLVNANQAVFKT
ncbi:unnamed protein product [Porites evermanni]|uniref:Ubiquitin carboxyl-terminal hydrolase n=1 Tax=Porites evermanni TaxID=104178 RepID=A0ABN8LP69_9CNID|nr:unnamed protein product [Porites evermanni]